MALAYLPRSPGLNGVAIQSFLHGGGVFEGTVGAERGLATSDCGIGAIMGGRFMGVSRQTSRESVCSPPRHGAGAGVPLVPPDTEGAIFESWARANSASRCFSAAEMAL